MQPLKLFASLLVTAGIGVAAASLPACGSDAPPPGSLCPPGQPCQARLTLLHTSDIHSRLIPYDLLITQVDGDLGLGATGNLHNVGGIARMAYVIGRERARADRVVHLDSGDCFQGAPIFNFFAGEPEVRALSMLGVDAAVIGNHEFDRGVNNIVTQFSRWSNFSLLGANYKFEQADRADQPKLGTVVRPFQVFNRGGLKVAAIGMGNLSSLTSIFDQPNKNGLLPLNTVEVAQGYVDLLRPYVDVIVMVSHMGLEVDQRMIRNTTGIDVVLGGHNHIVINPPQEIQDCTSDLQNPGFVWTLNPNLKYDLDGPPPPQDALEHPDPKNHPYQFKRKCSPRKVMLAHSGAFAKYVGRMDLVLSNNPAEVPNYDAVNGFEVISQKYVAFPIDDAVPEDPVIVEMLQPYRRNLAQVADLDLIVGFSPQGAKRIAAQGGDSPLGNLVAQAMWLRLGIQTDFSMTNSTGIRQDLLPGPVTIEQMYNIFPFDNSISKMQLSGVEVREMFDFVARKSSQRGCAAQAQIAGARVRLNCSGCQRPETKPRACTSDLDCAPDKCNLTTGLCPPPRACAEQIYIGHLDATCKADADCAAKLPGQCDLQNGAETGRCLSPISITNVYELATSNYLAGGGSGFRVLQRNTTQFDTKIQQRDALTDFIRQGRPCGYAKNGSLGPDGRPVERGADGLQACAADNDCTAGFVCACSGKDKVEGTHKTDNVVCESKASCDRKDGRCVMRDCRDQVAGFHERLCASSPAREGCESALGACSIAGEECKIIACVDDRLGAVTDDRVKMIGK